MGKKLCGTKCWGREGLSLAPMQSHNSHYHGCFLPPWTHSFMLPLWGKCRSDNSRGHMVIHSFTSFVIRLLFSRDFRRNDAGISQVREAMHRNMSLVFRFHDKTTACVYEPVISVFKLHLYDCVMASRHQQVQE